MGIALWICCGKRRIVVLGPRLERRTIAHPTVTHDLQTDDPGRPPARHTQRAAGAALAPGERFAPFGAAADGDGDRRLDGLDVSADEEDPTLGGGASRGHRHGRRALCGGLRDALDHHRRDDRQQLGDHLCGGILLALLR